MHVSKHALDVSSERSVIPKYVWISIYLDSPERVAIRLTMCSIDPKISRLMISSTQQRCWFTASSSLLRESLFRHSYFKYSEMPWDEMPFVTNNHSSWMTTSSFTFEFIVRSLLICFSKVSLTYFVIWSISPVNLFCAELQSYEISVSLVSICL